MNNDKQYHRAKDVFLEVCDLSPSEREPVLGELCSDDAALRSEVDSLLNHFDAHSETGPIQGTPDGAAAAAGHAEHEIDHHIGPYRIVRELGRGGMGVVYLAMRESGSMRQRVALKVLKRGMDTENVLQRFDLERRMLASLNHPNIARLYDTGETTDGRPYFVMEYVEGIRVDEYCDNNRLHISERLKLFEKICYAVAHAHKNLIVHRDLKPANIVVTADGEPKLLDFGIAKLINPDLSMMIGDPTAPEQRIMTPDYASPEQVRGEPITTASDVYSLGVVLYELLTGHRPYRIHSRVRAEIQRVICEEEPERPSTSVSHPVDVVTGMDESGTAITKTLTPEYISKTREGRPDRLRRRLAGDIDNIVLMAMRKEPHRRYFSADQFAEDIDRHLTGLPVRARRSSVRYRAAKFVRRNKSGVAIGVLAAVLAIGVPVMGWQAARATAAEAQLEAEQSRAAAAESRAQAAADKVRDMSNLLLGDIYDEVSVLEGATQAREILVTTALTYLAEQTAEPGAGPALQSELANAYMKIGEVQGGRRGGSLGQTEEAKQSFDKAFEIRKQLAAQFPDDPATQMDLAASHERLGDIAARTGEADAAFDHDKSASDIAERLYAADPDNLDRIELLARSLLNLGEAHLANGNGAACEQLYLRSLGLRRDLIAREPDSEQFQRMLTTGLTYVGGRHEDRGEFEEALKYFGEAQQIRLRLSQESEHNARFQRDYAGATLLVAQTLGKAGRSTEALEQCRISATIYAHLANADPFDNRAQQDLERIRSVEEELLHQASEQLSQ